MSQPTSTFWTFVALPASLLILAGAYYVKVPSVRQSIDARTPIVRQLLGRFVPDSEQPLGETKTDAPTASSGTAPFSSDAPPSAAPAPDGTVAATPPPLPVFDIQVLA